MQSQNRFFIKDDGLPYPITFDLRIFTTPRYLLPPTPLKWIEKKLEGKQESSGDDDKGI